MGVRRSAFKQYLYSEEEPYVYTPIGAGHKSSVPSITNVIPYILLAFVDLLDGGV